MVAEEEAELQTEILSAQEVLEEEVLVQTCNTQKELTALQI